MPELPEVETVRRSLLPIVGARIDAVEVREPRLRRTLAPDFARRLTGRAIHGIERRGKYLLFLLSGDETLLAHLGMSGALLLQPTGTPSQTHDHVSLRLSGDRQLTFNDPRRFGLLRVGPIGRIRGAPQCRTRSTLRCVLARRPHRADARPQEAGEEPPDGSACPRRHRQHLRQRDPLPRRHPSGTPGPPRSLAPSCRASSMRHAPCSTAPSAWAAARSPTTATATDAPATFSFD